MCGEGSEKDTRHFELDLKGWGLNYDVGDSMTVWPTNDPALVDELVAKIGAKGDETVKGPAGFCKACRMALFSPGSGMDTSIALEGEIRKIVPPPSGPPLAVVP